MSNHEQTFNSDDEVEIIHQMSHIADPFSISNMPHSISSITKEKGPIQPHVSPSEDPFKRISNITFEFYIYRKQNSKFLKNSESISHYYYCKNKQCHAGIIVNVNLTTGDIKYIQAPEKTLHLVTCRKVDAVKELLIKRNLESMRAYAIELYESNHLTTTNQMIIAKVLEKYVMHQRMNVKTPLPVISKFTIRNWLKDAFPLPPSEMIRSIIPHDVRMINQSPWVFLESITDNVKIYLASNHQRNIAKAVSVLLLDGTYKSTPKPFTQVLNGVGYHPSCNCYIPLFHVLMEDTSAQSYLDVLLEIFMRIQFGSLIKINFDFELALIKALYTAFPPNGTVPSKYELHGCYFHFTQALRKKFNELYSDDASRNDYLTAFLLIPMLDIDAYLDFLSYMVLADDIKEFFQYFMAQWGPNGRVSRGYWTIYNKKLPEISTNDGVERYNRSLNDDNVHPNFTDFCKNAYEIDHAIILTAMNQTEAELIINAKKVAPSSQQTKDDISYMFPDMFTKSGSSSERFDYKKAKETLMKESNKQSEEIVMLNQISIENQRIPEVIAPKQKRSGQKNKGAAKIKRAKKNENRSIQILERKLLNTELAKRNRPAKINEEAHEEKDEEVQILSDEQELTPPPEYDLTQEKRKESGHSIQEKDGESECDHPINGEISLAKPVVVLSNNKKCSYDTPIILKRFMVTKNGSWRVNYEDFSSDFNADADMSDDVCSSPIAPTEENSFNGSQMKYRTRSATQDKIVTTTSCLIQPKEVGNELDIHFQ